MNKMKAITVVLFTQSIVFGVDFSFDLPNLPFMKKERYVAVKNLYLHKSANIDSIKIKKLDFGEKLIILDTDKSTNWSHVTFDENSSYNDIKGYVPENALVSDGVTDKFFSSVGTITDTANNLTSNKDQNTNQKKKKGFSEEEEKYTSRKYKKGFGAESDLIQKKFSSNSQSYKIKNILTSSSIDERHIKSFIKQGALK